MKYIIFLILVCASLSSEAQTTPKQVKDSIKQKAVTIKKTIGIHSHAYAGIPGTYMSANPNIDLSLGVNFPKGFTLSVIKAIDVVDCRTNGNSIFFGLDKNTAFGRWSMNASVYYFDWQTKRFLDGVQSMVMPGMTLRYDDKKQFVYARWTYFAVKDPKQSGHVTEVSYGKRWKPAMISLHSWINSGAFMSDPVISMGLRLKPSAEIHIGPFTGSIIFDGNINLTNRIDETKKAAAKEALVIRTYWSF